MNAKFKRHLASILLLGLFASPWHTFLKYMGMTTAFPHIVNQMLSKVLLLIAPCLMALTGYTQDSTGINPGKKTTVSPHAEGKYCVMLKDGKVVVMLNETLIDHDIVFKDGSKLTPTGDFIKKGKTTVLKNGDCVDKNGELTIHTRYIPPKMGLESCSTE